MASRWRYLLEDGMYQPVQIVYMPVNSLSVGIVFHSFSKYWTYNSLIFLSWSKKWLITVTILQITLQILHLQLSSTPYNGLYSCQLHFLHPYIVASPTKAPQAQKEWGPASGSSVKSMQVCSQSRILDTTYPVVFLSFYYCADVCVDL